MEEKKNYRKINFRCDCCKYKGNIDTLEEDGYVERYGDIIIVFCPKCGEQTFTNKNKSSK